MRAGKKSIMAVYKTGTGTRRRGHWDVCVGTCDSGTRDEGLGDIMGRGNVWDGDAGRQIQGRGGRGV